MQINSRNKKYPSYPNTKFSGLDADEITILQQWAQENYPQYSFNVTYTQTVQIGVCSPDYDILTEDSDTINLVSFGSFLHFGKYFDQTLQETFFIVAVYGTFHLTEQGTLEHTLNKLHKYLIDFAYGILPANAGLNPKTKLFKDGLVNNAREV